jgi:cytochrome c oxidase subunit 4
MTTKIIPELNYYIIGGALLALTLLTYVAARFDFGEWNLVVALAIAACKGILIILYFMHARYANWLTWVVIAAGLLWFGILFVLTMSDYVTRYPAM